VIMHKDKAKHSVERKLSAKRDKAKQGAEHTSKNKMYSKIKMIIHRLKQSKTILVEVKQYEFCMRQANQNSSLLSST